MGMSHKYDVCLFFCGTLKIDDICEKAVFRPILAKIFHLWVEIMLIFGGFIYDTFLNVVKMKAICCQDMAYS